MKVETAGGTVTVRGVTFTFHYDSHTLSLETDPRMLEPALDCYEWLRAIDESAEVRSGSHDSGATPQPAAVPDDVGCLSPACPPAQAPRAANDGDDGDEGARPANGQYPAKPKKKRGRPPKVGVPAPDPDSLDPVLLSDNAIGQYELPFGPTPEPVATLAELQAKELAKEEREHPVEFGPPRPPNDKFVIGTAVPGFEDKIDQSAQVVWVPKTAMAQSDPHEAHNLLFEAYCEDPDMVRYLFGKERDLEEMSKILFAYVSRAVFLVPAIAAAIHRIPLSRLAQVCKSNLVASQTHKLPV